MKQLLGFVLLAVGCFSWIYFFGSEDGFKESVHLFEDTDRVFGRTSAYGAFCSLYVMPFFLGMLLIWPRRKRGS